MPVPDTTPTTPVTASGPDGPSTPDRCPRCGGAFACGMSGEAPCPCTTVTLSATQLDALRTRYHGCLCLRCLQALAAGAGVEPEAGEADAQSARPAA